MSRQDKSTTERHTRTLRELVKRPENKVCADCKRNDPRWASWNIGVFMCIRCSGIHRSMGTHISKVKSVDLDVWTPEQMQSIQKWGNVRANLYWEAHLKPGHIPAEHKMESFIRSKYESRRWALDGPPPSDPSVLDSFGETDSVKAPPSSTPAPAVPSTAPPTATSSRASHSLLSSSLTTSRSTITPITSFETRSPATPSVQSDLFNLDFAAPISTIAQESSGPTPKKDVKSDILSLFATSTVQNSMPASVSSPPAQGGPTAPPTTSSFMGQGGSGMWGAQSGWAPPTTTSTTDPWGSFSPSFSAPAAAIQPPNQNIWAAPPANGLNNAQNIWGAPTSNGPPDPSVSHADAATQVQPKKDDAFGDLWGGFK